MSLAVDTSNYTRPELSVTTVQCWIANGVSRVIVQAVQGGGSYPPGRTPQQLQACVEAGVRTDGYILPFVNDSLSNLRAKRSLTNGYRIGRWWGDFEEPMSVDYVRFVLREMDTWNADESPVGFYTGGWWLDQMRIYSDEFADRPLWIMDSTRTAGTPHLWSPQGYLRGWATYAMHQYWLDATLCGTAGIDVSYINPDFEKPPVEVPEVIRVGEGMRSQMSAAGDSPLFGHKFYDETDDDGQTYSVEECYGSQGRYVSSNSSGTWVNAGPF